MGKAAQAPAVLGPRFADERPLRKQGENAIEARQMALGNGLPEIFGPSISDVVKVAFRGIADLQLSHAPPAGPP